MVEVFKEPPALVSSTRWKERFYDWFVKYTPGLRFLVVDSYLPEGLHDGVWKGAAHCRATVEVTFNTIHLTTSCPGAAHLLKFAYHPMWRTSNGDSVFLVSPGFLGIVPSEREVTLRFGESLLWSIASWLSILTLPFVFPIHSQKIWAVWSISSANVVGARGALRLFFSNFY